MLHEFPMMENSLATNLSTFHYTPTIIGLSTMSLESICNYQFTLLFKSVEKITKIMCMQNAKVEINLWIVHNPPPSLIGFFPHFSLGDWFHFHKAHCVDGLFGEMDICCTYHHH